MLEYLNFFLICALFAYLYSRVKRYLPLLKMTEELIGNLGYETPQSDTKHQKLLKCALTGNGKLYLGKIYSEEQLAKLSEEEVFIKEPPYCIVRSSNRSRKNAFSPEFARE